MTSFVQNRFRFASIALACTLLAPAAFAVNKDMVQLQTQVQALQDAVARLQQSNDERMGVLKDLVQQNSDSINRMSSAVDALQKHIQTQQEGQGGRLDQVSGQVQSLNDSLDEIKARLGRLEKVMQDIQSQQQSMSANIQGQPAAAPPDTSAPMSTPEPAPIPAKPGKKSKPPAGVPMAANDVPPPPGPSSTTAAPPVDELYKTALGDYMAAKYSLASSEFGDVIHNYPDNPLAGNSYYYQAEIDYRSGKFGNAIKSYDAVLEQYPNSNKVPVSHLHKGQALLEMKQTDAGVRELRALIQRFPNSPEAMQARSKLNGMGIPIVPRH